MTNLRADLWREDDSSDGLALPELEVLMFVSKIEKYCSDVHLDIFVIGEFNPVHSGYSK